jgi:drug/metabolite transporter (DMT)-like permease
MNTTTAAAAGIAPTPARPWSSTAPPASFIVASSLLAGWMFGDRLDLQRVAGFGLVAAGMLATAGPGLLDGGSNAWIGDAMFVAAGLMWAGASVLLKRWSVAPMQMTAGVAVLSAAVVLPAYAALGSPQHLAEVPLQVVLGQGLVQGLLAGIGAVLAFTRSVQLLGPAHAALYPAMVPAFGLLIGVPLTGEAITAWHALGLGLTTFGLLSSIGSMGSCLLRARFNSTDIPRTGLHR